MAKRKKKQKLSMKEAVFLLALCAVVTAVQWYLTPEPVTVDMDSIPAYAGEAYVTEALLNTLGLSVIDVNGTPVIH